MQNAKPDFIVIDDSKLDCFIAERIIQNVGQHGSIRSFNDATDVLREISDSPASPDLNKTIIILDIQMPVMNGFEFADAFEKLPREKKSNFEIFMISSSVNENDRTRIGNFPSIKKLQSKPLSRQMVAEMIDVNLEQSV